MRIYIMVDQLFVDEAFGNLWWQIADGPGQMISGAVRLTKWANEVLLPQMAK